jgi:hypothetical protein
MYFVCSMDWGAAVVLIVGAAQVAAIVWAGCFAGSIAKSQLSELNKNERVHNTFKMLDDFFRPVDLMGFVYSPMNGIQRVFMLLRNNEDFKRFLQIRPAMQSVIPGLGEEDVQFFTDIQAAATTFSNYFVIANGLLDEERIQEKLLLEKVGIFAIQGLPALERLNLAGIDLLDLRNVVTLSRKYQNFKVQEKSAAPRLE